MISRLTALAALFATTFAVVTTATLAFAANSSVDHGATAPTVKTVAKAMPIYQLERVVITGKRTSNVKN